MKKLLILILLLALTAVSAAELSQIYILSINLNSDNSITLENLKLSTGYRTKDFNTGPYVLRMIDSQGSTLYLDKFDFQGSAPPADWFDKQGKQIKFPEKLAKPTTIPVKIDGVTLNPPYIENAKEIQIFDPKGKLELTINLEKYCIGEGCLQQERASKPSTSRLRRFTGWFTRLF